MVDDIASKPSNLGATCKTVVSTTPHGQIVDAALPDPGAPIPYFGRGHPQSDVLVVWGDAVGRIGHLNGLKKTRWAGAEIFHSLGADSLGNGVLLGIRKQGGTLVFGPRTLTAEDFALYDTEEGIGQYLLMGLLPENRQGPERLVLTGDGSGMVPLFIARMQGSVLVSNHLHLVVRAMHAAGLPVRLCQPAIAANWVSDMTMFLQQVVPETNVENVRMSMPGDRMVFSRAAFRHIPAPFVEEAPVTKDEYWDLIREGAKEIRSNVEAAANAEIPMFSTLTGGRDSRMFYAALRAAGLERSTPFLTNQGDQADVDVATGLVSRVGGHFGIPPSDGDAEGSDPATTLLYHRSAFFGTYGLIKQPSFKKLGHSRYLIMVGGFGEAYRAYYPNRYEKDVMMLPFNRDAVRRWLLTHGFWADRPSGFLEMAQEMFTQHLGTLPGDRMHQKLANQFTRFENRIHFGMEAAGRHYPSYLFFPLHSPSLLKLAPRVDYDAMRLGTIVFHVTRELCEEAPYLPHNIPAPDVTGHPFHTPSRFDAVPPEFSPDLSIYIVGKSRKRQRPVEGVASEQDFAKAVLSMMGNVIAELRDHPEGRAYLTPGLIRRAYWLKDRPTHAHRAWLARLASVRDVLVGAA